MSPDTTNPSGTWVQAALSAPMSSLTTTTICPRDNGPSGAEPRSAWLYSVVWSTTMRDCQGGSKRLACTGGASRPSAANTNPPSTGMNTQRVRRTTQINMIYSYDEHVRPLQQLEEDDLVCDWCQPNPARCVG